MSFFLSEDFDIIHELEFEGRQYVGRQDSKRDHGTALYVAAKGGELERVKLLVERGADVGKKSVKGRTAKEWALLFKKKEVWAYLDSIEN